MLSEEEILNTTVVHILSDIYDSDKVTFVKSLSSKLTPLRIRMSKSTNFKRTLISGTVNFIVYSHNSGNFYSILNLHHSARFFRGSN